MTWSVWLTTLSRGSRPSGVGINLLAATVHERDEPLRRRYGRDFVLDERLWSGRLTGRAFDIDGRGRWLYHRVLWFLKVRDGRIVRETVWNDLSAIRRQLQ